jgi:hypothetical protein
MADEASHAVRRDRLKAERCAGDSVKAKSELWRDWVPARRWDDGLLLWRCAVAAVRRDETWAPD